MSIDYLINLIRRAKLVSAVVFLQAAYAGLSIICASAMKQRMNLHTFVVYRMALATVILSPFALYFDRISRPKMTFSIIAKVMMLSLFDPVLNQNLFYLELKLSSPTFTTAMSNITPALAFLMAWIFRLEKVSFKRLHSLAKVLGTMITISGALTSTLVKGPSFSLPWAKEQHHHRLHQQSQRHSDHKDFFQGAIVIIANCVSLSCFIVLQTFTLRSYPSKSQSQRLNEEVLPKAGV